MQVFSGNNCGSLLMKQKHKYMIYLPGYNWPSEEEGSIFKHQKKLGNIKVEANCKFCPCENIKMVHFYTCDTQTIV